MTSIASYGDDVLQHIKIFHYDKANQSSIVFIHGGAWRDPNNTPDDFQEMASYIHSQRPQCNLFSLSYRLSPQIKHPYHLVDVVNALHLLNTQYGVRSTSLVGHSVGATLCLQLLNYKQLLHQEQLEKNVQIPDILHVEFTSIFFLDGIFDMVDLIEEYGAPYASFVENAFLSEDQYERAVQLSNPDFHTQNSVPSLVTATTKLYIVYSLDDELLSSRQNDLLVDYFLQCVGVRVPITSGHWGLHEEMYRNEEVSQKIVDLL